MDSLTDTVSLSFLRELVDWAEVDPLLTRLADVKKARRLTVNLNPNRNPSRSQLTCCWAEVDPLLTRTSRRRGVRPALMTEQLLVAAHYDL